MHLTPRRSVLILGPSAAIVVVDVALLYVLLTSFNINHILIWQPSIHARLNIRA